MIQNRIGFIHCLSSAIKFCMALNWNAFYNSSTLPQSDTNDIFFSQSMTLIGTEHVLAIASTSSEHNVCLC